MIALRWTLGLVTAVVGAGLVAISVIGGGFRRSFGASDSPLMTIIIVTVVGLILASLVWPNSRILMHIVAALMIAGCVGCAFIARESMSTAIIGALYALVWLSFYYGTVWAPRAP